MEFGDKLHQLRKEKDLTQEELANALFVSRTAVSKWESGRGYPSIDSLKEIASYFSVSIDDLLSSEKVISIAVKENKANIRNMCNQLFGIVDLFSFMLIVLPLYPNTVNGYIYAVNLFEYTPTNRIVLYLYWCLYLLMLGLGVVKLWLSRAKGERNDKVIIDVSMVINIIIVLFLGNTREAYAVMIAFMLLVVKGILLMKMEKNV